MIEIDSVKQQVQPSNNVVETLVQVIEDERKTVLDILATVQMAAASQAGFSEVGNDAVEVLKNISDTVGEIERDGGSVDSDGNVSGAMVLASQAGPIEVRIEDGQLKTSISKLEETQKSEMAKTRESVEKSSQEFMKSSRERWNKQIKATEENTKAVKDAAKQQSDSLETNLKGIKSLSGSLEKAIRNIRSGDIGGLGETIQGTASMFGEKGALGGIGGALGSIGGILTKLAPAGMAIGAATAIGSAIGQGIDMYQDAKNASINQNGDGSDLGLGASMKMQAMLTGYTTGLDQKEVESIQNNLVKGRAKYGTEEYDQGFGFALNAATNYSMEAGRAAQFYTDNVIKGGMAVTELNNVLESLSETVKSSDISMEEAMEDFENNVKTLGKTMGSESSGTQIAGEIQQMFGDNQDAVNAATNLVSQVNWTNDAYANTLRMQYSNEGYTDAESMVMASQQMAQEGLIGGDPAKYLASFPLTDGDSRTFYDYVNSGDKEGLTQALNNLSAQWQQVGGLVTIRSALTSIGYPSDRLGTNKDVGPLVDTVMDLGNDIWGITENRANAKNPMGEGQWGGIKNAFSDAAVTMYSDDGLASVEDNSASYQKINQAAKDADFTNTDALNLGLSYLSEGGLLSDELGSNMSQEEAQEMMEGLGKMYNESGDSRAFAQWVRSSEARSEVEDYISKYGANENGATDSGTKVDVELSWADGSDVILYDKVKAEERRRGMDNG